MSLTKLTANLNMHQSKPDKPSDTASKLKEDFDKPVNDIKSYINEILTSEIDTLLGSINTTLGTKANTTDVYNKSEIDTAMGTKANNSDVYTKNEINALVKGNVLWTGSWFMNQNQEAILSENISDQNNGIILIWSAYQNGQAQNWGFVHTFISKYQLQLGGSGVNCPLIHNDFTLIACKYVYINDNKIVGSNENEMIGTGSGITYKNNAFVLRAVVGI